MKLEEILPHLRNGKKAFNKIYDENGEYWIAGFIGLTGTELKTLTIHRVNKEGLFLNGETDWGIPRWLLMSDEWELLE